MLYWVILEKYAIFWLGKIFSSLDADLCTYSMFVHLQGSGYFNHNLGKFTLFQFNEKLHYNSG